MWVRLVFIIAVGGCVALTGPLPQDTGNEPRLVFTSLQEKKRLIYVVGSDGKGLRQVAGGRNSRAIWPTWSPEGVWLAYLTDLDGNWEVYATTVKGSPKKRLTRTPERETAPAWSPIISGGPCALPLADAPMPPGPSQSLANPENCFPGSWIAYILKMDREDQIFIMKPDGTGKRQLTQTPGRKIAPAWSPDGTQITFESDAGGNWDLYRVGLDGNNPVRLLDSNSNNETPVWSPDGRRVAFESERDGNWEIYVMDADGSNMKRLTHTPGADTNPAWSPDGEWLAFDTIEKGKGEIHIVRADGSGLRNMTNHPGDDIGPQWSPDGTQIAFSSDRDGRYQIYIMGSGGDHLRQVTDLTGDNKWPFWAPKGGN